MTGYSSGAEVAENATRRRPTGVVLVSILLSLIAIQGIVLLTVVLAGVRVPAEILTILGQATVFRSIENFGPEWAVGIGVVSVAIFLPLAVGFWLRQRWAWVGTMIAASINLTANVVARLLGDITGSWSWSEISLMLTVVVVFYLNLHDVQLIFRAPDPDRPAATMIRGDLG